MTQTLSFLFGRGWYVCLYLVCYFWYFVFPGMLVTGYMKELWTIASSGGDRSGGLGMVGPLIWFPIVVCPVLLISSALWAYTTPLSVLQKTAAVIGISIVLPIAFAVVGMSINNRFLYLLHYSGYFGLFALHLTMLRRFTGT